LTSYTEMEPIFSSYPTPNNYGSAS